MAEAVWLDNGRLRLGFVPVLGGRFLSIRLGGAGRVGAGDGLGGTGRRGGGDGLGGTGRRGGGDGLGGTGRRGGGDGLGGAELLWRNPALLDDDLNPVAGHVLAPNAGRLGDWVNYGGDKTWLAPQGWDHDGQWPGPPDPVLDSGPYTVDLSEPNAITMTSGADPRTGLRLTRRVVLAPGRAGYRMRLTATNVSDRAVRWALWNVTQFPGGGDVLVGLRPGRTPPVVELVAGTGVPRYEPTADGRVLVRDQDVVGKLGFPGAVKWEGEAGGGCPTPRAGTPRRSPSTSSRPRPTPTAAPRSRCGSNIRCRRRSRRSGTSNRRPASSSARCSARSPTWRRASRRR